MPNRKNRKLVARKSNNTIGTQVNEQEASARTKRPSTVGKQALVSRTNQINQAVVGRPVQVGREIKRSVICAAITLATMAALYFIFR